LQPCDQQENHLTQTQLLLIYHVVFQGQAWIGSLDGNYPLGISPDCCAALNIFTREWSNLQSLCSHQTMLPISWWTPHTKSFRCSSFQCLTDEIQLESQLHLYRTRSSP